MISTTWGQDVMNGIDANSSERILAAFKRSGSDCNARVENGSYGGYAWTVWGHKHEGDTAMHLVLRFAKAEVLEALHPLADVFHGGAANAKGVTSDELSVKKFGRPLGQVWRDAEHAALARAGAPSETLRPAYSAAARAAGGDHEGGALRAETPQERAYADLESARLVACRAEAALLWRKTHTAGARPLLDEMATEPAAARRHAPMG